MKKKLEAELISIAHRILKLKNKSELHQLHQEAQNLYEKLSVLRFVEDHFSDVKPTIGLSAIEEKIEAAFEVKEEQPEPVIETVIESDEEVDEVVIDSAETEEEAIDDEHEVEADETEIIAEIETSEETIQEEVVSEETAQLEEAESSEEEKTEEPAIEETNFKPAFELSFDTKDEEIEEEIKAEIKKVSPQITIDDLLGPNYVDPVFVKPDPSHVIPIGRSYNDAAPVISLNKDNEGRSISLNDRMAKGIIIGLNDRIAFMSHLFANSSEDYNRVLSQLMTFDTFEDAKNFIDNMVKPDYNNWQGKEEYAERFMEIVEKKFS